MLTLLFLEEVILAEERTTEEEKLHILEGSLIERGRTGKVIGNRFYRGNLALIRTAMNIFILLYIFAMKLSIYSTLNLPDSRNDTLLISPSCNC